MHHDPAALVPYRDAGYELIPLCAWNDPNVFPEKYRGKRPVGRWGSTAYTFDQMWSHAHNVGNCGVRLSPADLVVDVDPRNFVNGVDSFAQLLADLRLDVTGVPCVQTGSGGFHLYFKKAPDVPVLGSLEDYPGVEFKSHGSQVVAAGAKHYAGGIYVWLTPLGAGAPLLPGVLENLIRCPPLRPFEVGGGGEMDPEDLRSILVQLPVDEYRDELQWREIMMAANHATGGRGRYEFIAWCMGDPVFESMGWSPHQIGIRWDSLRRDGNDGGRVITKSTLYQELLRHGGKPPEEMASNLFAGFVGVGDAPEPGQPSEPIGTAPGLLDLTLDELNGKYAATMEGGKFFVYMLQADPDITQEVKPGEVGEDYTRERWVRVRRQDFIHSMENQVVELTSTNAAGDINTTYVPKAEWWLKNAGRRQYEGVWFHPGRELPGWLNLWRGFAYRPRKGSWDLLKQLLFEVLCDGSWECWEYCMNWSAFLLQKPWLPAEVALVFQGGKGVGKGTFLRALRKLCGRHGIQISNPGHLTGQFNYHMRDAIYIFADEAYNQYDKSAEASLKMVITEDELPYTPKGVDTAFGPNRISLGMASNSSWVVPATFGERRFAVFLANLRAQGNFDLFTLINEQLENGGYEAMLFELQARDISGWHPRQNIPRTKALTRQILETLKPFELWWYNILERGWLPSSDARWDSGSVFVWRDELMADLVDYTEKSTGRKGVRSLWTPQKLGDKLHSMVPGVTKQRKYVRDTMIRGDGQGRSSGYLFPPLHVARAEFERLVGAPLNW